MTPIMSIEDEEQLEEETGSDGDSVPVPEDPNVGGVVRGLTGVDADFEEVSRTLDAIDTLIDNDEMSHINRILLFEWTNYLEQNQAYLYEADPGYGQAAYDDLETMGPEWRIRLRQIYPLGRPGGAGAEETEEASDSGSDSWQSQSGGSYGP
jgi:hypothetical protein